MELTQFCYLTEAVCGAWKMSSYHGLYSLHYTLKIAKVIQRRVENDHQY
jgi:hypothetical protein